MADVKALQPPGRLVEIERLAERFELPPNRRVTCHFQVQALLGVRIRHLQPALPIAAHTVANLHFVAATFGQRCLQDVGVFDLVLNDYFARRVTAEIILRNESVQQLVSLGFTWRPWKMVAAADNRAISNEQGMVDIIASRRGRSRIFMVGIGSAPNSFLMNRAAEIGRGTFTHIGAAEQVAERMAELTAKLAAPAVTGLAASFSERGVTATPDPLPDVYAGEPLYIFARMAELKGKLTLSGLAGEDNWLETIDLSEATPGTGIAKLWARRAIANTEVNRTLGTLNAKQADAMILKLALDHQLVSRLTSLVAVDATPARPAGTPLTRADVPLNLPAGWKFEKVFGAKPKLHKANAASDIAFTRQPKQKKAQQLAALPEGSTPADLLVIAGLLMCLAGLAAMAGNRRKFA